jgi:hypothetical protein
MYNPKEPEQEATTRNIKPLGQLQTIQLLKLI